MENNIQKLYSSRFSSAELARKYDIWKVICRYFLQNYIKNDATIIDAACGYGEFVNNIAAKRKIAIDLNADVSSFLEKDIEFHNGNVLSVLDGQVNVADVIFSSNFLEHLPDKATLDILLDKVFCALRPGGKYLILGPNLRYLPGKYWDFYDHQLGLTHLSLTEALAIKGFKVSVCIDKFLPFTTKSKLPTHPLFVWLYLKFPLIWRFLGSQFFIVAERCV